MYTIRLHDILFRTFLIRFCNETYPPFSFRLDGTSYEESRNNFQNFHSQNLHQPRFTEPIGNPVLISQFRVSTGNTNTLKGTPGLLPFTKIDNPGEGQDGGELIKASLIVNRTLHPFIYIYIYIAYSIPTREGASANASQLSRGKWGSRNLTWQTRGQ